MIKILAIVFLVCLTLSVSTKNTFAVSETGKFSGIPQWAIPTITSTGEVNAISPPGQDATVTAATPATANAFSQAGQYAGLATGYKTLTDSTISNYYNPETVGIDKSQVTKIEKPSNTVPVYIYRNKLDIPFVYGKTDNATAFGAGYAAAQDKLFAMDVLRHLGSGTLADIAGPSCSFEQMDYAQISQTGYSPQERNRMINDLKSEGSTGLMTYNLVVNFIKGINARIAYDLKDPHKNLPIEYSLLGLKPQLWTVGDVISVLDVISAQDGEGGGGEVQNAGFLEYLDNLLGPSNGYNAFVSFKDQNDPNTPVTVDKPFPYMLVPSKVNTSLTAMPNNALSPLTSQIADMSPGCSDAPPSPTAKEIFFILGQSLLFNKYTSNAVIVSGKYTQSGHPIAVFGPQIGYYSPTVFMQEDLHGPDISASGVSLAGMNFAIIFGRGNNFAWSGTSSGADDIDQRIELLCNPNGGAPSPDSHWYLYKNRCLPMSLYTSTENLKPTLISPGKPYLLVRNIYKTIHGVVQGYGYVGNKPIAVSLQRAVNDKEQLALLGLVRWENPNKTYSATTWMKGAEDCPWELNWYYIDSSNIAYYSGGLLPIRAPGVNPNLPTWGTGVAEWQGFLTYRQHPQEINPQSGIIINWNNASAIDFSAADNDYSHGPVYRSQLLSNALNKILKEHNYKLDRAEVVQADETGGLTDMSATGLYAEVVKALGPNLPNNVRQMISAVSPWIASGGRRELNLNSPSKITDPTGGLTATSTYKYTDAIAIWDQVYPLIVTNIFNPILAAGGTTSYEGVVNLYNLIPLPLVSSPNGNGTKQGDSYGGGYEGMVWRILRQFSHESVGAPFSTSITSRICYGGLTTCRQALINAFETAFNQLTAINKTSNIASWTADTQSAALNQTLPNFDAISYISIGIAVAPNMVWQNRPTFQQVATFKTESIGLTSQGLKRGFKPLILVIVITLIVSALLSVIYYLLITRL